MPTEFKSFDKDLIVGYAPDIEGMKRNVRERDKQLVASWHSGDNLPGLHRKPTAEVQKEIRAELRQSFNNIRELQQQKEESPVAAFLGKIFKF